MNLKAFLVSCLLLAGCGGMEGDKEESPTTVNAYCTVTVEPSVVDLAGLASLEADDETEVLNISEIAPGQFEVTVCTFDFSNTNTQQGDINTET